MELNYSNFLNHCSAVYGERSISIYNEMGAKVKYLPLADSHATLNIDTKQWVPGIYIIRMEGDGKILQTQRLVVTN